MDQLRSLRVFTHVIAAGSFAGAARAIGELEQHLGVRLLNRSSPNLALTDIGEAYLQRATQIKADL